MDSQGLITFISIVGPLLVAIGGYSVAKRRNRKPWLWFIICLLMGLIGLLVVACSSTQEEDDEELEYTGNDILGWFMLVVSIVWVVAVAYISYNALQARHDAMVWDAMMRMMR